MTIRWSPDTCNCIVLIENGSTKFVNWEQKCTGHANLDGQALVDEIVTRCKLFQISKSDQKKQDKVNENIQAKLAAKNQSLGNVVKNEKLIRNSIL